MLQATLSAAGEGLHTARCMKAFYLLTVPLPSKPKAIESRLIRAPVLKYSIDFQTRKFPLSDPAGDILTAYYRNLPIS
jgi:hypothetical protein